VRAHRRSYTIKPDGGPALIRCSRPFDSTIAFAGPIYNAGRSIVNDDEAASFATRERYEI